LEKRQERCWGTGKTKTLKENWFWQRKSPFLTFPGTVVVKGGESETNKKRGADWKVTCSHILTGKVVPDLGVLKGKRGVKSWIKVGPN